MIRAIHRTATLAAVLAVVGSLPATAADTPQQPTSLQGKVIAIADGDTLAVLVDRTQHRIRLHGIDSPEKGQAFGNKARQALAGMVFGKPVQVRVTDKDRYGRLVGVVTIGDQSVNHALVAAGWAWWYRKYAPDDKQLAKAEAEARAEARLVGPSAADPALGVATNPAGETGGGSAVCGGRLLAQHVLRRSA
jgi:endonuclease YncB( thermonuclease family)